MALDAGTRLGPYEVLSRLGAGGMGEVYRARDIRLGRHVALKVLAQGAGADPTSLERLEREARTISSLSHPAICALFDVGEQDGQSYLVMECLEGETLAARLGRGPLAVADALRIGIQLADGLAHAHASNVVHRDLKPANVMLLPEGTIKILDFGIARRFAESGDATVAALTASGAMVGTVAYMSPEQTLGERVDYRSDLFSLGVLIYEMLCGVRPFEASSPFSVMKKVVSDLPNPPEFVRADVTPAIGQLLRRMMAKAPVDRPASAGDVATEMRALAGVVQTSLGSPAPPLSTSASGASAPVVARWIPRTELSALAVVVVAGVVAVLAVPALRTQVRTGVAALLAVRGAPRGEASREAPVALPRTAAEWTRQGRAYLRRYDQKGNLDRAIEAFGKAVELDASSAAAYAGLSESYRQKDSATPDAQLVRQSIESGQRAVTLTPDLAAGHAALGLALLRAKQPDDGRQEIQKALDLDATNLSALLGLGEYYLSNGDPAQAEAVYRRAMQAAPSEWIPAQLVGRSLFGQAKYAEAAAIWEEADRATPDNVQILRNLGAVYQMLERNDEAVGALQRALAIEPTATVYSNLGTLRFFQGRYSDAVAASEKAVELNPTYFLYWANLGDAYRWVPGAADKARQAFARAITLVEEKLRAAQDDPDHRTRLALYLAKQDDSARALRELQRWKASAKHTPASHFRALVVYEIVGEREEALLELNAALRAGYAAREIQNEPELTRLRSDPRYHRIVAAFETARR